MRNYAISTFVPHNWVMISKYCLELDQRILSVQNYIDFSNPNKIILNYIYNKNETEFYSLADLVQIQVARKEIINYPEYNDNDEVQADYENLEPDEIIKIDGQFYIIIKIENQQVDYQPTVEPINIIGININKLYPGQIVYNNFGHDVILYADENDITGLESLIQGSAIFKILDEQKDYQIIALDSTGDFYVLYNVDTTTNKVIFKLLPHASSEYGMNYLFSFTAENARWFYIGPDAQLTGYTLYAPEEWHSSILTAWSWTDERVPNIISAYGTLWSANSTISHEIFTTADNKYSEVFCDESIDISSQGVDNGSRAQYTINTNMSNTVANAEELDLRIALY